ncbi:MAG: limonene-1,2-epoxide hydrolase family protein [Acidimicrobiales bacterium]
MSDEQPIDTVQRFCEAWGTKDLDEIISFFSDDAVYHNIPLAPVVGPDQIRTTIEGFSGGVEQIVFRVDAIAANGGTVLTERHDIFTFANGEIDLPVMGAFEVTDGKITAWRDYFDMNQFMSQMPV